MITPKDRMINALNLKMPLDYIPTFDNDFELVEAVGKGFKHFTWSNIKDVQENFNNFLIGKSVNKDPGYSKEYIDLSLKEKDKVLVEQAEAYIQIAEKFEWAGISVSLGQIDEIFLEEEIKVIKAIKKISGNKYFITGIMRFGTMPIPTSSEVMIENAIQIKEKPEELKERLEIIMNRALSRARKFIDAGCDGILETADYATNMGTYYSISVMREFVFPYLFKISETIRNWGVYIIKHTDGDLMEVFDDIIDCRLSALHSIQKVGKMDMKIIKEKAKNKVCLIGNVSSNILQNGTIEQMEEETVRSIKELSPGGGYIFSADNSIFRGVPLKNYEAMINKWREIRICKNI
jgi:hypothetical protein